MTPRRYTVLGLLGRGGFGAVYKAEARGEGGFSKLVALKMLDPKMEDVDGVAARLRDEARILGLLQHRGVARVDGLVRVANRWTIVMELIDGADLARVARAGPVPVGPAVEIVAEVAGVLHAAWSTIGPDGRPLQLLHRDIKPSNIQLTRLGEVKLLDFGIARADFDRREALTRSYAGGTEAYMSPERRDLIDLAAGDVYSLGVTLWELVTGRRFGMSSGNRTRHEALVEANLDVLREVVGPGPLVELVREMVAYDPDQRPVAGEVERRCLLIRSVTGDLPLRYWAERAVPAALAAASLRAQGEELPDGSALIEDAEETTRVERPSRLGWVVALVAVLGLGLACSGGAGLLAWWAASDGEAAGAPAAESVKVVRPGDGPTASTGSQPAPDVSAAPPPSVVAGSTPGAEQIGASPVAGDSPGPRAAPPATAATALSATATSARGAGKTMKESRVSEPRANVGEGSGEAADSQGSPGAPEGAAEGAPPARAEFDSATVRTSDGTSIRICHGETCVNPQSVPPGTWEVRADFGQGFEPAGSVKVGAGQSVVLRCRASFHLCAE